VNVGIVETSTGCAPIAADPRIKGNDTMKIKVSRTTRANPGETMGFEPETLFTHIEIDVENLVRLINLKPQQLVLAMGQIDSDDRLWHVRDPLMFHTLVTSMKNHRRRDCPIRQLLALMKDHLTDEWVLSWDTLSDMELEIHTDDSLQGVKL